jgi:phosphoribosyl 1,2-cyclic phosphate phosphodiesterase
VVEPDQVIRIAGVEVLPLAFRHGHLRVFGYRFGGLAYITDVKGIDAAEREHLLGLDVLVLNALWWRPHPTHMSIPEAIDTARSLGARRTYLTHLTHETSHAELEAKLPAGILPAYDGLTVEVA